MKSINPTRMAGGLLIAVMVWMATGCNREKTASKVAGKVTYNGTTLTAGSVNFVSASGAAASSKIDSSGNYSVDEPLQAGEYKVFVSPPVQEPTAPGTQQSTAPTFAVPPRFREPGSSGVTVMVKAGKNEIPVQFSD